MLFICLKNPNKHEYILLDLHLLLPGTTSKNNVPGKLERIKSSRKVFYSIFKKIHPPSTFHNPFTFTSNIMFTSCPSIITDILRQPVLIHSTNNRTKYLFYKILCVEYKYGKHSLVYSLSILFACTFVKFKEIFSAIVSKSGNHFLYITYRSWVNQPKTS